MFFSPRLTGLAGGQLAGITYGATGRERTRPLLPSGRAGSTAYNYDWVQPTGLARLVWLSKTCVK